MSLIGRTFVALLNHLLEPSAWARDRLAAFAGSQVSLRVAPVEVAFSIDQKGFACESSTGAPADVTLSFPLGELPGLLSEANSRSMGAVSIEGNAELADTLGFVFRNLKWDVEDDLSRMFGDIPARRLVLGMQSLKSSHDRAIDSLGANMSEYLVDEQHLLVGQRTTDTFGKQVQTLRDDTARLEKRVERLEHGFRHRKHKA